MRKTLREDAVRSETRRKVLFKHEKRCLKLLSFPDHPNIVPLLSSYIHGKDHCLLFPVLDMDLAVFFERASRYGNFQWNFTFFSALHGLSSALSRTHDVHVQADADGLDFTGIGYHHDLRPANILVNKETFILADFGMSQLKGEEEGSQTNWKLGFGDYLAPECMDENFVHQNVGRAIDVWAFGCLMAEVATFMYRGPKALSEFRALRESATSFSNIITTCFHDSNGKLKESVKEWLSFLTSDDRLESLDKPLYELIVSLLTPAKKRPKMAQVCKYLAHLSLKAHFFAVLELLTDAIGRCTPGPRTSMKLWLERERLQAFGSIAHLSGTLLEHLMPDFVLQNTAKAIEIMVTLFHRLSSLSSLSGSAEGVANELSSSSQVLAQPKQINEQVPDEISEFHQNLETDVQRLIQELWDLLPDAELRNAETQWVRSMLKTNSIQQLDDLGKTLGAEQSIMYQQGAAMTMMRKIRLEMLDNPKSCVELHELETPETDVTILKTFNGHQLGVYNGSQPVLIEKMLYDQSWEKVPASERTLVMALKTKGFSVNPKPRNLRLLECFKFFEIRDSKKPGYGFVYRLPASMSGSLPDGPQVITLLDLLSHSEKHPKADPYTSQPILDDKFRLASVLVGFLAEFHNIGWLHENFHPNNVIFFTASSKGGDISLIRNKILQDPYIVGLNKSRPGGKAWHTQGPALEMDFVRYQHPDYYRTHYFRGGYDYYSLGLMLLEIGLWTPLHRWTERKDNLTLSPHQIRDMLVHRYVPRLGLSMGETYRDIVKLLLSDGLDPNPQTMTPDSETERNAFNMFFDLVVGPLGRISEVWD